MILFLSFGKKYKKHFISTENGPSHKLDTLLNPDKAAQYLIDKEKAMGDIRADWHKVVT